jgi:nucleotide-binding universal stress UspA family protein
MLVEKVLITTDFSKQSTQLIQCIPELKSIGLKEVVLVHVIDIRSPGGAAIAFKKYDEQMLDQVKAEIEKSGLLVKPIVALGFPAGEIVQIAQQEKVDMILIASHGKGFIKQRLLGSTAADVIRLSSVPILVEKYLDVDSETCSIMCRNKFAKVLIPTDFSVCSQRVLKLIKQPPGIISEVVLVHVIERAESSEVLQAIMADRSQLLEDTKKELEAVGLKVTIRIEEGDAPVHIVDIAEKENVTSIVLATRGEGFIKGLLVGSTADAVTRKSKRPVVLIPCRN